MTQDYSLLTADDLYLFNQGTHNRLFDKLGSHCCRGNDAVGVYFAVWAPEAEQVFVIGNFNSWDKTSHPLRPRERSGIWEGFILGIGKGTLYKYHIISRHKGYRVDKADPFANATQPSPPL